MSYLDIAAQHIAADEGRRKFPYVDTVGKITIGVGHNLTDDGLPDNLIDMLFDGDLERAESVCRQHILTFDALTDNRKAALMDMAFCLDSKIGGFHDMIAAIARGDWKGAAAAELDSDFAREVGTRANRIADMLENG
jgi:GH24 family phage-related lysozyme (muramidase)